MNPTYRTSTTLAFKSPQEVLGLSLPVGKRIASVLSQSWVYLLLMVSAIGMVSYVFQMNHTATKGFTLRETEKKLEQLRFSVTDLEDQVAQKRALYSIEQKIQGLGYVEADRIEFIVVKRDGVALK